MEIIKYRNNFTKQNMIIKTKQNKKNAVVEFFLHTCCWNMRIEPLWSHLKNLWLYFGFASHIKTTKDFCSVLCQHVGVKGFVWHFIAEWDFKNEKVTCYHEQPTRLMWINGQNFI